MSLPANEEQIKSIDKAVEEHLAAVQVLRSQRNCLVPISQLPPEILSRIFSLIKLSMSPFSGQPTRGSLAWITVTHVSTHWRSVAMNSPILWDEPQPEYGPWVKEMLKRSETVDLSIMTDLHSRTSHKLVGLRLILRNHGTRIRRLALYNLTSESGKVLRDLPVTAPRLEILCLRGHPLVSRESGSIRILKTALNNTENLFELELSDVSIPWRCLYLSNITHLTLHYISDTARPRWTQFMDVLAKIPKLESLDFKFTVNPSTTLTADTSSSPIHLSCLQRLNVESPTTGVGFFFRKIAFPLSAIVHVKMISRSRSVSKLSAVISSIAQLYSCQEFLTLALRDSESCGSTVVRFQLFAKVFERPNEMFLAAKPSASLKVLTLETVTSDEQLTVDKIIPEFFKNGFPLSRVSHAELATNANFDTLTDTLGNLPALSYIRIERESGISFVRALYPHSEAVDAEYFPLYFRNLESVSLSVMFESDNKLTESVYDVDLELLQDCLIQRYECGAEVQQLTLYKCHRLDDYGVQELEDIVVDVEWDRVVQGFECQLSDTDSEDYDQ